MDALAFGGSSGKRNLVLALRKLSDLLEAGIVSIEAVDTSSAISVDEHSMQHIAITYVLSESPPGLAPAPFTPLPH